MDISAPKGFTWGHFLPFLLFLTIGSIVGAYIFFTFFFGLDGALLALAILIGSHATFTSTHAKRLWAKPVPSNITARMARRDLAKRATLSVWLVTIVFLFGLVN